MKEYRNLVHKEGDSPCDCGYIAWLVVGHLLKMLKANKTLTDEEAEKIITNVIETDRSSAVGGTAYRTQAAIKVLCETADILYWEPPDLD